MPDAEFVRSVERLVKVTKLWLRSKKRRRVHQRGMAGFPAGRLSGYVVKWGEVGRDRDGRKVRVLRGAFADVLRSRQRVLALIDHNPGRPIGSTADGRLKLWEDEHGLRFSLDVVPTRSGMAIGALTIGRVMKGMSFNHIEAEGDVCIDDLGVRIIRRVGTLLDIGPTTHPAFPGTSVRWEPRRAAGLYRSGMRR
jgi:HK97 family phage prohead protease